MSRKAIKWGQLQRFLRKRGFEVTGSGGEKMIRAPKSKELKSRSVVCLGHKSCSKPGNQVYDCYINQICNAFGVTRKEIEDA